MRLRRNRRRYFTSIMPRKRPVPSIPEKPTGRTKPEPSRVAPKHRPHPSPEQFDLWGAFAAPWEVDQTVEAVPQRRAKARQRRGLGYALKEPGFGSGPLSRHSLSRNTNEGFRARRVQVECLSKTSWTILIITAIF